MFEYGMEREKMYISCQIWNSGIDAYRNKIVEIWPEIEIGNIVLFMVSTGVSRFCLFEDKCLRLVCVELWTA